ncbi:MAG: hypothetical protein A3I24_02365 [Candidatus Harrisonbacteria bacterium RIFCSPLOWO2_02_FULL_41_13b]|uniref:Bacterial type II secretion system protein E domain-containing protein n=1 Tax=Candidatus Harrisonbacteria bacterium RIFCSPLOWO2_02_FULL_41_13b TaxID=1798409 RepID=A0A1G1ZVF2_9BACT|nr:MAG: hypothetical protein A3J53_02580 [Candidatus Harrisonbacteria bacterium RIFCSPHIGHO2_02_FULL_40_20]OGY68096.1 MAG: hypothetical protein A3I24_02365 [Candidatus Harrisonbacteria bacterium RIFCSPLOWO2_02_FULL_41_13b]
MENNRLLTALVEAKLLNSGDASKLEADSVSLKKDAESLIYQRHLISEEELAKVKGKILGIPYKKIDSKQIKDDLLELIPKETAFSYKIVPLSKVDNMLVVGMVAPDNPLAQNALKFIAKQKGFNVGVYLITPTDFDLLLRRYSPLSDDVQQALGALSGRKGQPLTFQQIIQLEETKSAIAEEAPIIKIVASLLKEAVNIQASDIHIEPQRKQMRVRFRVDGVLQIVQVLPIEIYQQIISRIKVLSNLKLDETRIPQDGRFRTIIFDREIDFRISTFPTPLGEKAAIRVLDPNVGLKGFGDLGLVGKNQQVFSEGLIKPYGMVLLTGPTGSGKTTTLYAAMQILNKEGVNVVSLEDPVEYSIDGLNQSQVRPEIGYDFASGLRQILRQDPDVILVGEIRDSETASLAVHAALTGHIVLTTLHTNNAVGVIPRLVDLKLEPFLLPSSVNLMVAQRLVARLCQNCKKPKEAPPSVASIIKKNLEVIGEKKYKEPYKIYYSPGCGICKNKGTTGRLALFEVFAMTPELADILAEEISENKLINEAKRQNMISLRQDGILKALDGLVMIEDVLRETEELW